MSGISHNLDALCRLLDIEYICHTSSEHPDPFVCKWLWILNTKDRFKGYSVLWIDYDVLWTGIRYTNCERFYRDFIFRDYDLLLTGGWSVGKNEGAKYHSLVQTGMFCMRPTALDWLERSIKLFIDKTIENKHNMHDQSAFHDMLFYLPDWMNVLVDSPPWYIASVVRWNGHMLVHVCGVKDKVATAKEWLRTMTVHNHDV
ncbi:MAG: hypothetical protein QXW98_04305 [Candidatus Caldarchaeum sp.]